MRSAFFIFVAYSLGASNSVACGGWHEGLLPADYIYMLGLVLLWLGLVFVSYLDRSEARNYGRLMGMAASSNGTPDPESVRPK